MYFKWKMFDLFLAFFIKNRLLFFFLTKSLCFSFDRWDRRIDDFHSAQRSLFIAYWNVKL